MSPARLKRLVAIPVFTGLLALAAAGGPARAAGQNFFEHKDWSATCDVDATCRASAEGQGIGSGETLSFEIMREPKAGVLPVLRGYAPRPIAADASVILSVDDHDPLTAREGVALTIGPQRFGFAVAGERVMSAVLEPMIRGRALTLTLADTKGRADFRVSLSGLTAALRWIDARQGRAGRRDALVATGSEPAQDAPAPRLIEDRNEIPGPVAALWRRDGICSDIPDETFKLLQPFAADMGEGQRLWVLPCGGPGAYNALYALYAQSEDGTARQLQFAMPGESGWIVGDTLYNLTWDHGERTIEYFYKGRGLGDCGAFGRYRWTGWTFELVEARAKDDCDGNAIPLDQWPRMWPPK